jgi:EAL domain-containing protein (putative c-di-GMP-specific phosphodiesterase class I)
VTGLLRSGGLIVALQPIVTVATGRIEGVEALARFPSGGNPETWLATAEAAGLGRELELLALRRAFAARPMGTPGCYLSVNVSPRTLIEPDLLEVLLAYGQAPGCVHVEVTEHSSIDDYAPATDALRRLRGAGARIAVDDVGAGFSSFRHVLQLRPEVVKLDRSLVTGIHADPARRALVTGVLALAREIGARLVAEGVESAADLHTVAELGIPAAQGWHLGRPSVDPQVWRRWFAAAAN